MNIHDPVFTGEEFEKIAALLDIESEFALEHARMIVQTTMSPFMGTTEGVYMYMIETEDLPERLVRAIRYLEFRKAAKQSSGNSLTYVTFTQ